MEKKIINKIIGIILIIAGTLRTLLFSVLILFTFDAPETSRIIFERGIFILYLGIGSLAILSAGAVLLINRKSGRIILLATAVSLTIKQTGLSIIYTSIVLIAGFVIFCASSFGGTFALGWLTSLTLVVATVTNLLLLPVLLLMTKNKKN